MHERNWALIGQSAGRSTGKLSWLIGTWGSLLGHAGSPFCSVKLLLYVSPSCKILLTYSLIAGSEGVDMRDFAADTVQLLLFAVFMSSLS